MTEETFEPTCDKCGAPLVTGIMAAICPHREKCEFWPEDQAGVAFIRWLRKEISTEEMMKS